jgi:acyl-CoA thioesterase
MLGAMNVPAGDFVADTQVRARPDVPGRFEGNLPLAWQIVDVFGGITMATTLRAMQAALARPELRIVSASAMFVDRVPCGPVTIDTEVLRSGKSAAQVTGRLRTADDGGVALHAHAVFGVDHDVEHGLQDVQFPDVPPPEECDPPPPQPDEENDERPWGHINFHDQNDWRPANGIAPWLPNYGKGEPRMCSWVRLVKEPLLEDGTHDPLVLAVYGDQIGTAVGQGLGPVGPYFTLSLEIALRFIATPTTPWVLQDAEAWHVGNGYATGPTRLWGSDRRLLAIATQTANLRFTNR